MSYSRQDLRYLLSIANEAANLAGKRLSGSRVQNRRVLADKARDIKIAADRQSESAIARFLQKEAPFSILTEEAGLLGKSGDRLRWIVDPLDGTMNYSRGMPVSCVSIGFWDADAPLLGVVYDFNRSEVFSGISDGGAWLNGRKIRVSRIGRKNRAILLTGFPSRTDFSVRALSAFVDNIRSYKKVRLLGSAALSLAYVAAGRADAYYEKDIMLWDIAGGVPIVLGAGGACRTSVLSDGKTVIEHAANKALIKKTI